MEKRKMTRMFYLFIAVFFKLKILLPIAVNGAIMSVGG